MTADKSRYTLEIYEESLENDPSHYIDSTIPFLGIHIGEKFNHRLGGNWEKTPAAGERFFIKDIEHLIWDNNDGTATHKILVAVEIRKAY